MSDEENDKGPKKDSKIVLVTIIIVLAITVGALTFLLFTVSRDLNREMVKIRQVQDEQFNRHVETNQFLLSTIDWSARRMKLILFMRDQIVDEWKRIKQQVNLDEAYLISETIVKECENYSYIDPFFILSTQFVESSFRKKAISPVGAKGINQIMPATGRLLAGYFGIEYSDSLLFNIQTSTKFAIKLFDFLHVQHNSWDVVLADYNGGPWQAYYYLKDKKSLAKETSEFVPKVLKRKEVYDSLFVRYKINDSMIIGKTDSITSSNRR
jgi:soluble lytic murein transglycosylase-like protein